MAEAPHTVAETAFFEGRCRRLGLSEADREDMITQVARDPSAGDMVRGSGGLRKVRWGGRGGYRLLVAYFDVRSPAVLMAILAKNEQANFTPAQINALNQQIKSIKDQRKSRRNE